MALHIFAGENMTLGDYTAKIKNWISNLLGYKYDKSGGEISGDVKVDGAFALKIEDEDYDAGIRVLRSLDNNLGAIVQFQGYANNSNYRPIIRGIHDPDNQYDAANKKYVDEVVVIPTYHLVVLHDDWSVDLKASSLQYAKILANMTDPHEADYLDVFWKTARIRAMFAGVTDVNTGSVKAVTDFEDDGTNYHITFTLAPDNTLSTSVIITPTVAKTGEYADLLHTPSERATYVVTPTANIPTTETVFATHTIQNTGDYILSACINGQYTGSTVDRVLTVKIKVNDVPVCQTSTTSASSWYGYGAPTIYQHLTTNDVVTMTVVSSRDSCKPMGIWYMSVAQI